MIGLVRLTLRFVWLAIMIQGVRKVMETAHEGAETLITRIESGDESGLTQTIVRLHHALHRRDTVQEAKGSARGDVYGEV